MATQKTDKKVVKTPAKKAAPKKTVCVGDVGLEVPLGGQIIGTYELTPKAPKNGKASEWKLVNTGSGNQAADEMTISFQENSTVIQRDLERAVVVIDMVAKDKKGSWRFALSGVNVCATQGDQTHDIQTEIINNGRTLVVYVHSLALGQELINYSFVAAYTDTLSGETSIYASKDPTIWIKRP